LNRETSIASRKQIVLEATVPKRLYQKEKPAVMRGEKGLPNDEGSGKIIGSSGPKEEGGEWAKGNNISD